MNLQFKDKVVMLAASSSGLGFAIARACAAEGANISMASRNTEKITNAAESIRKESGTTVLMNQLDVSNAESINGWTSATLSEFGRIDALLVNAGGPPAGSFNDFTDQDWEKAYNLTLMSAVRMIRAVLPQMQQQKSGSILAITSSSVKEPIGNLLLSNVFRSGVNSLVKSLAPDLAKDNIRINNLIPGRIDTERVQSLDQIKADQLNIAPESLKEQEQARIPLGRYGKPEEFASAAAFLLSDAASYITGASLQVDGGLIKSI